MSEGVEDNVKVCAPEKLNSCLVNGAPVNKLPEPKTLLPLIVLILVPETKASCLPLNVLQSVELNAPLLLADAVGKLKVCVSVAELIAKSAPVVPVAKYCT